MSPETFLKTIYLGDRLCKSLQMDGFNSRVILTIDTISRIRSVSGDWEYYTKEDIDDGLLVFDCVSFVSLTPAGFMPNDWIEIIGVEPIDRTNEPHDGDFKIKISLGSMTDAGVEKELQLVLIAKDVYLVDPKRKEVLIRD